VEGLLCRPKERPYALDTVGLYGPVSLILVFCALQLPHGLHRRFLLYMDRELAIRIDLQLKRLRAVTHTAFLVFVFLPLVSQDVGGITRQQP
jgi:hypothetical protein